MSFILNNYEINKLTEKDDLTPDQSLELLARTHAEINEKLSSSSGFGTILDSLREIYGQLDQIAATIEEHSSKVNGGRDSDPN